MSHRALQQTIAALVREADAESLEDFGPDRDEDDGRRLATMVGGRDPRTLEILAWATRTDAVMDALNQVWQVSRGWRLLAEKGVSRGA